jgi:hypothetical protein
LGQRDAHALILLLSALVLIVLLVVAVHTVPQ